MTDKKHAGKQPKYPILKLWSTGKVEITFEDWTVIQFHRKHAKELIRLLRCLDEEEQEQTSQDLFLPSL